jgi:hypothetical protein
MNGIELALVIVHAGVYMQTSDSTSSRALTLAEFRTLALASLGGALEFYDFVIFVFFTAVIGKLFFSAGMPTANIPNKRRIAGPNTSIHGSCSLTPYRNLRKKRLGGILDCQILLAQFFHTDRLVEMLRIWKREWL